MTTATPPAPTIAPRQAPPVPPMPPVDIEPAITVTDLCLTYKGGIQALSGVTLQIPAGLHVAVLGNSGSGKTTLVGCLSGRLAPSQGRVNRQRSVATIHQDLRLVKQRTALQNVLHGSMGRLPLWRTLVRFPARQRRKAIGLLKRVGLGHRLHAKVSQLSGGEQQRVAIARALMQDPAILLADEPVASLDKNNAQAIMQLLRELGRERELTLVSVLHDCSLAENYADRIVGLDAGRIVYDSAVNQTLPFQVCDACEVIRTSASGTDAACKPAQPDLPPWFKASRFAAIAIVAMLVYAWASAGLDIGTRQLNGVGAGLMRFLRDLRPTSWAQVQGIPWGTLAWSLIETIQMSLIGTTLGVLLSWPLAAVAAKNVGPRGLRHVMRFILNGVRTVPSLIWALLFVAAVGFGPLAGVLALVAYSVGYLTKFFYEAFESVDRGPPSALGEIGASGLQQFLHAVWPAARPAVLSSCLFMLEYNVRAASVLGIVGAGGIGYYIMQFLDWRNFPAAMACLVMLLAVVVVLDAVSTRVRARLVQE